MTDQERSWRRPHSLRSRLLVWMGVVHVLAAVFVAWFSYASLSNVMATAKDEQMQMLANSYSESAGVPTMQNMDGASIVARGVFIIQIWSTDGRLLSTSWPQLRIPLQDAVGMSDIRTGTAAADEWRVYSGAPNPSTAPGANGTGTRVQVALSAEYLRQIVIDRALKSVLPIALLLPFSFAVLWIVVWSSSRALRTVALDVAVQDERSLSELSPTRVPDEIAPLVVAYNSLLARLRHAFAGQRRFVQDAAHELRTPIAAVGLQLENLRGYVPAGDAAERFAQLEAGVTRSQHLIEQLLKLSRQENAATPAAEDQAAATPVDVAGLLRESVGQLMVVADRRQVDVGFEGRVHATVRAPVADLRSVFDNLIGNALRYVPEGGVVDVVLHDGAGHPVVDVIDNGPGIAPEYIGRAFDRFFRVPGTAAGGSGLGLSIARMAAERNGLRIELLAREKPADGPVPSGLVARVHLPIANDPEGVSGPTKRNRRSRLAAMPSPSTSMRSAASGYKARRRQIGAIRTGGTGEVPAKNPRSR